MTDKFQQRTADLTEQFTNELGAWVRERMPVLMSDSEFASSSAALMIALNRQLAACAVAFGNTHGLKPEVVADLMGKQLAKNHALALVAGEGMVSILQ